MLKFTVLGVPVGVDWWFWLTTILLGGGASAHGPEDWLPVGVWVMVVFVSILVHEFGHALAGRRYGATPVIVLQGFGGVTLLPGVRFTRLQNILVSAAGPAAGLSLGALVLLISRWLTDVPPLLGLAIRDALYVNFFWTAVNLLPIQPLDGGQILGQALGPKSAQAVGFIGFVVAGALCVWTLSRELYFSAFMLAMLAYYNLRRIPVRGGVITS
jgi:Zn-dependent protease